MTNSELREINKAFCFELMVLAQIKPNSEDAERIFFAGKRIVEHGCLNLMQVGIVMLYNAILEQMIELDFETDLIVDDRWFEEQGLNLDKKELFLEAVIQGIFGFIQRGEEEAKQSANEIQGTSCVVRGPFFVVVTKELDVMNERFLFNSKKYFLPAENPMLILDRDLSLEELNV